MGFGLMKCSPYRELIAFPEEWDTLFGDFWSPVVDVEETEQEFLVKVQLPGLKKDEIKLQVEGDSLIISGERKAESEKEGKKVHLRETVYGKFQRVLGLPANVEGSKAGASYEAGVLTVHLPKAEQAKPKEIVIEVK